MRTLSQIASAAQQGVCTGFTGRQYKSVAKNHLRPALLDRHSKDNNRTGRLLPAFSSEELDATRDPSVAPRFSYDLSQIPIFSKTQSAIQTKVAIGQSKDPYEREAVRVAEQVMRMPETALQEAPARKSFANIAVRPAGLQPAAAPVLNGGAMPAMLAIGGQGPRIAVEPDVRPLAVLDRAVRCSSGVPLPNELRTEWGARLGRDLAQIRIHTDAETGAAVEQSGTNALNFGPNVFFAPGRCDLRRDAGRRLLGHELAHALETESRGPLPAVMPDPLADRVQARADTLGVALASGRGPVAAPAADRAPALRGDKQIAFNAKTITVSDEYVLYGPAANAQVLATFQSALNTYYNNPKFNYRNYQVVFQLTARLAGPNESNWFKATNTWINVETASLAARAWGIPPFRDITIFDTSAADVIAHEVGHLLSDRVGIFSEGYSENLWERGKYVVGLGPGGAATVKPEAVGDIMSGPFPGDVVSTFSLSGILDNAISQHEHPLTLKGVPR